MKRKKVDVLRRLIEKYSPDQPRDEEGKFSDGGGGGDSGGGGSGGDSAPDPKDAPGKKEVGAGSHKAFSSLANLPRSEGFKPSSVPREGAKGRAPRGSKVETGQHQIGDKFGAKMFEREGAKIDSSLTSAGFRQTGTSGKTFGDVEMPKTTTYEHPDGSRATVTITENDMGSHYGREVTFDAKVGKAEGDDEMQMYGSVAKLDEDQRLVFGWASVIEKDGEPVVDSQGDVIEPHELEKAAYDFVLYCRDAGEMHRRVGVGKMVESVVFTKAKLEAMGLKPDALPSGWWVGFKVDADVFAKIKSGEYQGFSIGGSGTRAPLDD